MVSTGFVELPDGVARFVLVARPATSHEPRGLILGLQPFGDEATLARRVMVAQARQMAEAGWEVWIPDLFGTGDSAGLTEEASLERWRADIDHWLDCARSTGGGRPTVLWGVRIGALLAIDAIARRSADVHLLAWQLPVDGKSVIGPLQRLGHLTSPASGLGTSPITPTADPFTPASGAEKLTQLAGYRLPVALIDALTGLNACPGAVPGAGRPRHWMLVHTQRVVRDDRALPAAMQRVRQHWDDKGWSTASSLAAGEPFWSSMEPSTPDETFAATLSWLAMLCGAEAKGEFDAPGGRGPETQGQASPRTIPFFQRATSCVDEGFRETAESWDGAQGALFGVLCEPANTPDCRAAALIVAGQPQTRVGSHRMFVDLARGLARAGVTTLRFDVGGWGDSPGEAKAFEQSAEDIVRAVRRLAERRRDAGHPSPELWVGGLCDGASAAVCALPLLARHAVRGVYLINPWVRSDASHAAAMVKSYYARRLLDREFWARLLSGRIPWRNLVADPWRFVTARWRAKPPAAQSTALSTDPSASTPDAARLPGLDLPALLLERLQAFRGEIRTVLSGNDLTAAETESLLTGSREWRRRLAGRPETILRVAGADHTFSQATHWDTAIAWLAQQMREGDGAKGASRDPR